MPLSQEQHSIYYDASDILCEAYRQAARLAFCKGSRMPQDYLRDFGPFEEKQLIASGISLDELPRDSLESYENYVYKDSRLCPFMPRDSELYNEMVDLLQQGEAEHKKDAETFEKVSRLVKTKLPDFDHTEKMGMVHHLLTDTADATSIWSSDSVGQMKRITSELTLPLCRELYAEFLARTNAAALDGEGNEIRAAAAIEFHRVIGMLEAIAKPVEQSRTRH